MNYVQTTKGCYNFCCHFLLFSQDGHDLFGRLFDVKLPDHLLNAELTLFFIHHTFPVFTF